MRVMTALLRTMPIFIEALLIVVAAVADSGSQRQAIRAHPLGDLLPRATRNDRQWWLG